MLKSQHYYQNQHSGDGSWSDFLGDAYSGITVGIGHSKWFVEKTIDEGWKAFLSLFGVTQKYVEKHGEIALEKRGLEVVGVGYGRTGTFSLALALDELGFPTLVSGVHSAA